MSQRERILALAAGGLVVAVLLQWGFGKYRSAIQQRNNRIAALSNEQKTLREQLLQGAYADRQMGEYLVRSLPSDPERARSDYQKWLLGSVQEHQIAGASVDPTSSVPVGELYHRMAFRVSGRTDLAGWTEWLYDFYAKDYLHRIGEFSISPSGEDGLNVDMTIDAIALSAAPADAPPPQGTSWRVEPSPLAYREAILNRNFFEPPKEVDEPPMEAVEEDYDDARQTVLTALVQGRDDWTAWMNVRTLGKTLKLKPGDEFAIGSLRGKVVKITPRHVLLEIDGRRFELRPAGNLGEAVRRAQQE